jgi:hypothetical protein
MIKRLVEKLYYKCYPDRKNEHEIATMSLPVIKEERHNVRHRQDRLGRRIDCTDR